MFSEAAMVNKLAALPAGDRDSLSSLSQWFIFYRKHVSQIAEIWAAQAKRAPTTDRQLLYVRVADNVMVTSRRQTTEFLLNFGRHIPPVFEHIVKNAPEDEVTPTKEKLRLYVTKWSNRKLFVVEFITHLEKILGLPASGARPVDTSPPDGESAIASTTTTAAAAATTATTTTTTVASDLPSELARCDEFLKREAELRTAVTGVKEKRQENLEKLVEHQNTFLAWTMETYLGDLLCARLERQERLREVEACLESAENVVRYAARKGIVAKQPPMEGDETQHHEEEEGTDGDGEPPSKRSKEEDVVEALPTILEDLLKSFQT